MDHEEEEEEHDGPSPVATTSTTKAHSRSFNSEDEDEDEEEGGDTFNAEATLKASVKATGVVTGKVYRSSVTVLQVKRAEAPPEKCGYMTKKSPAMFQGWQKRYFLTNSNGDIEYYKTVSCCLCEGCLCVMFLENNIRSEVDEFDLFGW